MNLAADALSTALLHSLWQNVVVAILFWVALAVLSERSAHLRYAVSCAALAVMVAIPTVTAAVLYARALPADGTVTTILVGVPDIAQNAPGIGSLPATRDIHQENWLPWLRTWALPVWFVGVLVFSLRLVSASAYAIALKRRSQLADEKLASIVAALAARVGVTRSVAVLTSTMMSSPATLGWIRPVILLPPATALGITPQQLEALIAHELAHIRRHDYLVNVLQMMTETLFFYHPAVWWASRRIRVERELCCDDIAIDTSGDALVYAQALTSVARLRLTTAEMVIGASGGLLVRRIQRVLGAASTHRTASPAWLIAAVLVMAVAVMTGTRAQSPTTSVQPSAMKEAVLRGQIIDARDGQPVSGASVRAQYSTEGDAPVPCGSDDCDVASDPTAGRILQFQQSTGSNGRFEIRGVSPGTYFVEAAAPGYVPRYFGQTANDMPPVAVNVPNGQSSPAVDIRLEPVGAVAGRVFSDSGDGLAGVEVELIRRSYLPGGVRPIAVAFAQTEELGVFRIRDVEPGEYYVRAYVSQSIRPTRADMSLAYVATFFPEATEIETAQPLFIASGQELLDLDISLATMKMRVVSGQLVDRAGRSLATASVRLTGRQSARGEIPAATVTANGSFRIDRVPPGDYLLAIGDTARGRRWKDGVREIAVRDDVTDLLFEASPSSSIEGRIVRQDGRALPFEVGNLDVSLEEHPAPGATIGAGNGDVQDDGTFSIQSGSGPMYLHIAGLLPPWNLKVATLNGVDVTDEPFELGEGRHYLEIMLTDRVSRLSGIVTDRSAQPLPNILVVVFPEDPSRWGTSRLIKTTFSHQQGRYEVVGLPAANYRVVAVNALPRGAWTDPAVLDRLWTSSTAVRLQEGQQQEVRLKVVPSPTDLIR